MYLGYRYVSGPKCVTQKLFLRQCNFVQTKEIFNEAMEDLSS